MNLTEHPDPSNDPVSGDPVSGEAASGPVGAPQPDVAPDVEPTPEEAASASDGSDSVIFRGDALAAGQAAVEQAAAEETAALELLVPDDLLHVMQILKRKPNLELEAIARAMEFVVAEDGRRYRLTTVFEFTPRQAGALIEIFERGKRAFDRSVAAERAAAIAAGEEIAEETAETEEPKGPLFNPEGFIELLLRGGLVNEFFATLYLPDGYDEEVAAEYERAHRLTDGTAPPRRPNSVESKFKPATVAQRVDVFEDISYGAMLGALYRFFMCSVSRLPGAIRAYFLRYLAPIAAMAGLE